MKKIDLNGFTLIELLVTIAVIGVLGGIVTVAVDPIAQLNKAKDGQRKADISQIQSALEQYRFDNSSYPAPSSGTLGPCGSQFAANGVVYLQRIPCDPDAGVGGYYYSRSATNASYCIRACLKRTADAQSDASQGRTNNFSCGSPAVTSCPSGTTSSYTVQGI